MSHSSGRGKKDASPFSLTKIPEIPFIVITPRGHSSFEWCGGEGGGEGRLRLKLLVHVWFVGMAFTDEEKGASVVEKEQERARVRVRERERERERVKSEINEFKWQGHGT